LSEFILKCQDAQDGGISDRPGNMADIFHTFFGICGLSLLGFFNSNENGKETEMDFAKFRAIDPTYALPVDITKKLGLAPQVLDNVENLFVDK
jgi:geranylgeranyl transferase type-2 subunit beta